MGRSLNAVPDISNLGEGMKKAERYQLISQVTRDFWTQWSQEVTPEYVIRKQWHESGRNLQPNDIVLIHDKSSIKGKYLMGKVVSVNVGSDGRVRSCSVGYTVPNKKEGSDRYTNGRKILVTRSIQRLSLLLPVEEQNGQMEVFESEVKHIV